MPEHLSAAMAPARSDARIRETISLVGIAVALPVVVHFVPAASVPWGARLLPMFYAPLLGALLYRLHVGLIPAILAPCLNALITGSPVLVLAPILTVELTVFTLVAFELYRRWSHRWPVVVLSYALAKAGSAAMIGTIPWFEELRPPGSFTVSSFVTALPGLLALSALVVVVGRVRSVQDEPKR